MFMVLFIIHVQEFDDIDSAIVWDLPVRKDMQCRIGLPCKSRHPISQLGFHKQNAFSSLFIYTTGDFGKGLP